MQFDAEWAQFGIWYLVFLLSTTVHEAAHAWVADRGGDSTAAATGHLTLDPLVHIRRSPFGMVVIPLITFFQMNFLIGWASVPFNARWGKEFPRRQAMMSAAGPLANFVLAGLGLGLLHVLVGTGAVQIPMVLGFAHLVEPSASVPAGSLLAALCLGISVLISLNVLLGVFNLLPLPPLDGAGVAEGLFPKSIGRAFDAIRAAPMMQLVTLMIAWQIMPSLIQPVFGFVFHLVQL